MQEQGRLLVWVQVWVQEQEQLLASVQEQGQQLVCVQEQQQQVWTLACLLLRVLHRVLLSVLRIGMRRRIEARGQGMKREQQPLELASQQEQERVWEQLPLELASQQE